MAARQAKSPSVPEAIEGQLQSGGPRRTLLSIWSAAVHFRKDGGTRAFGFGDIKSEKAVTPAAAKSTQAIGGIRNRMECLVEPPGRAYSRSR